MTFGIHASRATRAALVLAIIVVAPMSNAADADDLSKAVDEIGAKLVESKRTAGLSIAIAKGGETIYARGYGLADIENAVPVTSETVFRIGSVTKQFSAVAVMQLIESGKLDIADLLAKMLPDYPDPPAGVTLRHLLQHTSGIPSFTGLPSYRERIRHDDSHADMIARFSGLPVEFVPGSKWAYNNSGYYLLGMIVERASGQTFEQYLSDHVFTPAGLDRTAYEIHAAIIPNRARGYRKNGETFENAQFISMLQPFSAGALVSTAPDLVRWQRALVDGRLSPKDVFERITSDTVETGESGSRYAYGIGVSKRDGTTMISHGGGIDGFASMLAYFPDTDHTVAILSNTEGTSVGDVLTQITRALFEDE